MAVSIFDKIIQGDVEATFLHNDDHCIVINDIHPQAPVHFLVIPKKHLISLQDAQENDQVLLGHLLLIAAKVADDQGLPGYRLLINNGQSAGQTVMHLHIHVLGGRRYQEAGLNR